MNKNSDMLVLKGFCSFDTVQHNTVPHQENSVVAALSLTHAARCEMNISESLMLTHMETETEINKVAKNKCSKSLVQ